MEKVREVIVVEGRYDKNAVSQAVDATIIETNGFQIFSDNEKLELLRKVSEKRGIIILTDSDGAGFLIRGHLKGRLPKENIKEAYIPDIYGKEKRKAKRSAEGKLGVEGMEKSVIIDALKRAGATFKNGDVPEKKGEKITKSDLFLMGLSGGKNSADKRKKLLKKLNLPERMSPNQMLDILNLIYDRESFFEFFKSDPE